jgi:hypothetical protein
MIKLPIQIVMVACASASFPLCALCQTPDQNQPSLRPGIGGPTSGLIQRKVFTAPASLLGPGGIEAKPYLPLASVVNKDVDVSIVGHDSLLKGRPGLRVYVRNRSDRALLCTGYEATATVNGATYSACSPENLQNAISPPQTVMKTVKSDVVATVTATALVGAVQTAQDQLIADGPVLKRYGPDQHRRGEEEAVFGKRILWPGDSTSGIIYFDTTNPLDGASLNLPISAFYDKNDRAVVTVGVNKP